MCGWWCELLEWCCLTRVCRLTSVLFVCCCVPAAASCCMSAGTAQTHWATQGSSTTEEAVLLLRRQYYCEGSTTEEAVLLCVWLVAVALVQSGGLGVVGRAHMQIGCSGEAFCGVVNLRNISLRGVAHTSRTTEHNTGWRVSHIGSLLTQQQQIPGEGATPLTCARCPTAHIRLEITWSITTTTPCMHEGHAKALPADTCCTQHLPISPPCIPSPLHTTPCMLDFELHGKALPADNTKQQSVNVPSHAPRGM